MKLRNIVVYVISCCIVALVDFELKHTFTTTSVLTRSTCKLHILLRYDCQNLQCHNNIDAQLAGQTYELVTRYAAIEYRRWVRRIIPFNLPRKPRARPQSRA